MSTSNLYCISITLLSIVLLVLCVILFCFLRHSGKIEVNVSKDKSTIRKNVFPFLFSTMSFVTSFIALAMILPNRNAEMNFNYYDVIVGILSLLITILLGWQIYNGIKFEEHSQYISETKKEIEDDKNEIDKHIAEIEQMKQKLVYIQKDEN